MKDALPAVAEAIKITYFGPKSMKLDEINDIIEDGFMRFDAYISYEIIGAFLQNDRVKVVVKIYSIQCNEIVEDYAMVSFQRELQRIISKKFPEAKDHIDVCPIRRLVNEE